MSSLPEKYFEDVACPVCGKIAGDEYLSVKYSQLKQKQSLDYSVIDVGPDSVFKVDKCRECGMVYVNPRVKREYEHLVYNDAKGEKYSAKDLTPEKKLSQQRVVFEKQASAGRVLLEMLAYASDVAEPTLFDFGCGMGHSLVAARAFGIDGYGIDIDKARILSCQGKGLKVECPDVFERKYGDVKFDLVVWQSNIEHLLSPRDHLETVRSKCSAGAILHVNGLTPGTITRERRKGNYVKAHFVEHVNYFPIRVLDTFFKSAGFTSLGMSRYTLVENCGGLVTAAGKLMLANKCFGERLVDVYGSFSRFYTYDG